MADSNRKLWLRFDGVDEATAVVDSSPVTKTVTPAGAFALDTSQYKFGSASGLFTTGDDVLTVTDHADFTLGAAWTIECWLNSSVVDASYWRHYVDATHLLVCNIISDVVRLIFKNGAIDVDVAGTTPVSADNWHHLAFTFDGTTARVFLDGALDKSVVGNCTVPDFAVNPAINYGGHVRGWLDEFAIFNACKYTASFTPRGPRGSTVAALDAYLKGLGYGC